MKKTLFLAAMSALSVMVSCRKEEAPVQNEAEPIVFSASINAPADTRVSVDMTDGKVSWVTGDEITITEENTRETGVYTAKTDGATTDFAWKSGTKFTASGEYSATYGARPAAGAAQLYDATPGKMIHLSAPSVTASGAAYAVNFHFTADCGLLKLNIKAGGVSVSKISVSNSAGDTYNLVFPQAQDISSAKDFYIALPEGTYTQYVVYPTQETGSVYHFAAVKTAKTGKGTVIENNKIKPVTFNSLSFTVPVYPESGTIGIKIGDTWWAPVNCGYDAADFKFGKLYQWGRHDGCGYVATNQTKIYNDAGGLIQATTWNQVSIEDENSSNFYIGWDSEKLCSKDDWCSTTRYDLWDASLTGLCTELGHVPERTQRDPCPDGWRVPTLEELSVLHGGRAKASPLETGNHGTLTGVGGLYMNGTSSPDTDPKIFLPAAGERDVDYGYSLFRGSRGIYLSSSAFNENEDCCLCFTTDFVVSTTRVRAKGGAVRCVLLLTETPTLRDGGDYNFNDGDE